jgi:hypothetical protein
MGLPLTDGLCDLYPNGAGAASNILKGVSRPLGQFCAVSPPGRFVM